MTIGDIYDKLEELHRLEAALMFAISDETKKKLRDKIEKLRAERITV